MENVISFDAAVKRIKREKEKDYLAMTIHRYEKRVKKLQEVLRHGTVQRGKYQGMPLTKKEIYMYECKLRNCEEWLSCYDGIAKEKRKKVCRDTTASYC